MKSKSQEMVPVPIPTEVPAPPQLDKIPLDILHSATVELLIQQNEDLSSRLKVNIRRNSQLEMKILEHEREIQDLNRRRENVIAQMEIIKEKENIWHSKKEEKDRRLQSLEKEVELFELRYNELHTMSQQKNKEHQQKLVTKHTEIQQLERKLRIFMKVRSRAKEKLRDFLVDLATGLHRNKKSQRQSESSLRRMQQNVELLKSEFSEKEENFVNQLNGLKEVSTQALRNVDLKLESLKQENNLLEDSKNQLNIEIMDLKEKLHQEAKNRIQISSLNQETSRLKNEKISIRRELESSLEKIETSRLAEKKKVIELTQQLKESQLQFQEQKQVLTTCEDKLLNLSKDNREMSDQLMSLRKLWVETQDKLEKVELKCNSLEKLNRQLSKQNKDEKIHRAVKSSQIAEQKTIAEARPEISESNELQDKIKDVFASQYRTIVKSPEMDL